MGPIKCALLFSHTGTWLLQDYYYVCLNMCSYLHSSHSASALCEQNEERRVRGGWGRSVHLRHTERSHSQNQVMNTSVTQNAWRFCLKCAAQTSSCACWCRWFKEGRLLTDQEKYPTYSETRSGVLVLVIKNLTERDLGHYECEVGWEKIRKFPQQNFSLVLIIEVATRWRSLNTERCSVSITLLALV